MSDLADPVELGAIHRDAVEYLAAVAPQVAAVVAATSPRGLGLDSGYFHLPLRQAAAWGITDAVWLRWLARTTYIAHLHFSLHDQLVDAGTLDGAQAVVADVCLTATITELARADGPRDYAQLHLANYGRYARTTLAEIASRGMVPASDAARLRSLCDKSAPGDTLFTLIADRAGRPAAIPVLLQAVAGLTSALQVCDDLMDAADDYLRGVAGFPVAVALRCAMKCAVGDPLPEWERARRALWLSGSAELALHAARILLERAGALAGQEQATSVASAIGGLDEAISTQLDRLRTERRKPSDTQT